MTIFFQLVKNYGDKMSNRIVYVNGEYLNEKDAKISVFDRSFLFADAVYEVTTIVDRKILEWEGHYTRLLRSLNELEIPIPLSEEELIDIHRNLISKNSLDEGIVYLQISRGIADRDFNYPENCTPSIVLFTQDKSFSESIGAKNGIKIITVPDIRWARRDIKTVQLLGPSMCKMMAKKAGKDDAWMVENGFVNEGTSNNAHIITKDEVLITRNTSNSILAGVTRASILKYADNEGIKIIERPFSVQEALNAKEAFISSASQFVCPVIEIDNIKINDGKPGKISKELRDIYINQSIKNAI